MPRLPGSVPKRNSVLKRENGFICFVMMWEMPFKFCCILSVYVMNKTAATITVRFLGSWKVAKGIFRKQMFVSKPNRNNNFLSWLRIQVHDQRHFRTLNHQSSVLFTVLCFVLLLCFITVVWKIRLSAFWVWISESNG